MEYEKNKVQFSFNNKYKFKILNRLNNTENGTQGFVFSPVDSEGKGGHQQDYHFLSGN